MGEVKTQPVIATCCEDIDDVRGKPGAFEFYKHGDRYPAGMIYCCPRNADAILIIDPFKRAARKEKFGLTIPSGENKWTRFVTGPDGKLYATPANRTDILVVDPIAQSAVLTDLGTTIPPDNEKWIGGVLSPNGKIYCTPDKATNMLVIDVAAPPLPANLALGPLLNKSP